MPITYLHQENFTTLTDLVKVCYVFQRVYFLQQHLAVIHHVSHEMVLYINVISVGMISWVLFQKYFVLTIATYLHISLLKSDS